MQLLQQFTHAKIKSFLNDYFQTAGSITYFSKSNKC